MPDVTVDSTPASLKLAYAAGFPKPLASGVPIDDAYCAAAEAAVSKVQSDFNRSGPDARADLEAALHIMRGQYALHRHARKKTVEGEG